MEILPSKLPAPRLLSSIAANAPAQRVERKDESGARLSQSGIFCGASRWWFLGIIIGGGLVIFGGRAVHDRYLVYQNGQRELQLLQVATAALAAAPHSSETPYPITIQYTPAMLQVTSIALGHPRLAVINGRALGEGDTLVLHAPTRNVAVTLRVERIVDGHVDLSDGMHTVTAHLAVPSVKQRAKP